MNVALVNRVLLMTLAVLCFFFAELGIVLAASAEPIGKLEIPIKNSKSEILVERMVGDVRAIFRNYRPGVDSTTTLLTAPQISGSSTHPFMNASMRKCVTVFVVQQCESVELKADITVSEESGKCTKNFLLKADISKSSEMLSNHYGELNFHICFKKAADGTGVVRVVGEAEPATQQRGVVLPVKGIVFDVLKLQLDPIGVAIQKTLKALAKEI